MAEESTRSAVVDPKDRYLSDFATFARDLNGKTAIALPQLRRCAIERFGALGFPTRRDEEWRDIDLEPILRTPFALSRQPDPLRLPAVDLSPHAFSGPKSAELVFVDGYFAPPLSTLGELPARVCAIPLARALEEQADRVVPHLGRIASWEEEPFAALNTAFWRDGAFVHLPQNLELEAPIHLLFVATGQGGPAVSYPRVLVVADPGSRATLVETYAGLGEGPWLTVAATEIAAAEGSAIDHYWIQDEDRRAFHLSTVEVREARNAQFRSTSFALGGRLSRHYVHAVLEGEGSDATLDGLYLADGEQQVDNRTLIEHCQPRGISREFYKGILAGKATGVFRGKILVHQAAQQTDAYQANRNLLLSAEAEIDARPQLEIYADDVKCSHGATVGQLDEEALFYLRSRGLGAAAAARVLIRAFAGEIVERVRPEGLRAWLDRRVVGRLARAGH